MPAKVGYSGSKGIYTSTTYTDKDIKYKYNDKLNLRPGSELHENIKDMILSKAEESYNAKEYKHSTWRDIDDMLTAFIPNSEEEKELKAKDPRKPTSVVVSVSYATLETLLAPLSATFIRDPMFRYVGTGPEDVVSTELLERVIQHNCYKGKVGLNIHVMLRDALVYGFGAVHCTWEEHWGFRTIIQETPIEDTMTGELTYLQEKIRESAKLYEGNRLENIDPYMYLPDPNVPVWDVQRGEFAGWVVRENMVGLLEREQHDDLYFNARYLQQQNSTGTSRYYVIERGSNRRGENSRNYTEPIDVIYMYINLIPSELGLGDSEYPEKWLFALAADDIIIAAHPLGLNHNRFPIAVCAPDFDGYSLIPTGKMEKIYGLQTIINFMLNSFVENQRKAINDMLVVDPKRIDVKTLEDPGPGGIITLNEAFWGTGLSDAISQLDVHDVTANHIPNALIIEKMAQQITGATEPMMGIMRKGGERRSATEARDTLTSALGRIDLLAKVIGMQAMDDIAYMFAEHFQQFADEDVTVRILGNYSSELARRYGVGASVTVNPYDLVIDYDVVPHDGTSPYAGNAETWLQLFQMIGSNEHLMQRFDIVRVFEQVAQKAGAKDIVHFMSQQGGGGIEVRPDEEVAEQVAAGRLSPI